MNYGKKATEKKIKAAGSRSRKYTTRVFLTFFKTCLILCTFCLIVAVSMGAGMFMGIIDSSSRAECGQYRPHRLRNNCLDAPET